MPFIWWEKTVEYAFILEQGEPLDFAAPLAGAHETAADAIFGNGAKLLLVEFKRDEAALASEKDKYENYDGAKALMSGRDGHHLIVFGERVVTSEEKTRLSLAFKTYFARDDVEGPLFETQAVEKAEFDKYLADLLLFKKRDGRSSGRLGAEAFASVIGLTANNELVNASLEEYMEQTMSYEQRNQLSREATNYEPPEYGV
ncbi:hypothetical protein PQR21_23770 [Paraburkholderia nemoris]|uniref:hypothetical protein n=1 Tax=Paraburkholderia nemoris TaxID=2793076 RepID=UPI0038BD3D59